MFLKRTLIQSVALAASVSACGGQTKKKVQNENTGDQQTAVSAEAAKTELDSAPEYLIVKVPVDADGKEQNDQFETKELSEAGSFDSAEGTDSSFNAGADADIINELDADTSSQQWHFGRGAWYWNTPWYPGKLLGRGLWWGRNPYHWYGGYQYGYNHYRNYNYGGCNYYVYRRPAAVPLPAATPVQLPAGQNYPTQQIPGQGGPGDQGGDQGGEDNQGSYPTQGNRQG